MTNAKQWKTTNNDERQTWTTLTNWTTMTILTDQYLIKKINAEFALFTWSCFFLFLSDPSLIIGNPCHSLTPSLNLCAMLFVQIWCDEISWINTPYIWIYSTPSSFAGSPLGNTVLILPDPLHFPPIWYWNQLERLPLSVIKQFRAHPLPDRPTHTRVVLKATFNCSVDSTTLDVGDLSEMEKDVDEQDMVEGGCGSPRCWWTSCDGGPSSWRPARNLRWWWTWGKLVSYRIPHLDKIQNVSPVPLF